MVGLSMALTIAVCIGSFVWIYAQVEPFTRDFVDAATVRPTTVSQATEPEDEPTESDQADEETPEPSQAEAQTPEDNSNVIEQTSNDEPEPTSTPTDEFNPTHVVSSEVSINFRQGPGVNTGDPVTTLAPGTELQYLGDSEASQDPNADGDTEWLHFKTEDGLEGWIRRIDVSSINAGQ
jgi:hypothetical protein